jgi:hypothetical protein
LAKDIKRGGSVETACLKHWQELEKSGKEKEQKNSKKNGNRTKYLTRLWGTNTRS